MSEVSEKYRELEIKLLEGRARGATDDEEEVILDEMDSVWYKMTKEEIEEARKRARDDSRNVVPRVVGSKNNTLASQMITYNLGKKRK